MILEEVVSTQDKTNWRVPDKEQASSSDENSKVDEKRIRLLKSFLATNKCQKELFLKNNLENIPREKIKNGIQLVFDFYQSFLLFKNKKISSEIFIQKINNLHLFEDGDNGAGLNLLVIRPARSYLDEFLNFDAKDKAELQSVLFDFLPDIKQPQKEIFRLANHNSVDLNFEDPKSSQMDKVAMNGFLLRDFFEPCSSIRTSPILLLYGAWFHISARSGMSKDERKNLADFISLGSETFREDGGGEELLHNSEKLKVYLAEFCQHTLETSKSEIVRMSALRGLQFLLNPDPYEKSSPEPALNKFQDKVATVFKNEYLPQASPEVRSQFEWLKDTYGSDFLESESFISTLNKVSGNLNKQSDAFGFINLSEIIEKIRKEYPDISADTFLLRCAMRMEKISFFTNEKTFDLIASKDCSFLTKIKVIELIESNNKDEKIAAALQSLNGELINLLEKIPLPTKKYTEMIRLWSENGTVDTKTGLRVDKKIPLFIEKNIQAMLRTEELAPGSVVKLIEEPFSICFFNRYNPIDLANCSKMFDEKGPQNPPKNRKCIPGKTLLLTGTYYDWNGAFYNESHKEFFNQLREEKISFIIVEIDSPAHLFRSLKKIFELNGNEPFSKDWIFQAHARKEGIMQIGSSNEPTSFFLPSAATRVFTEKVRAYFNDEKVNLMLNSCYAGINWIKQLGTNLNWEVFGQDDSAYVRNFSYSLNEDGTIKDFDADFFNEFGRVSQTRHLPE